MSELLSTVNYMTKHNFIVTRYNYISHSNYVLTIPLIDGGVFYISAKYIEHCLNVNIGIFKVNKNMVLDSYDAYIDPVGLFNNMDILIHMLDGDDERVDRVIIYYDTGCMNNECKKNSMMSLQYDYTYETEIYNYRLMKEDDDREGVLTAKSHFIISPVSWDKLSECSEDIVEMIYGTITVSTKKDVESTKE